MFPLSVLTGVVFILSSLTGSLIALKAQEPSLCDSAGHVAPLWLLYRECMDPLTALHPLPEHVLPFFLDVLRDVHPALAAPVVKASLQQVLAIEVDDVIIRNVVFKL